LVDDLDVDIEHLEAQLRLKRKDKEMLVLERDVYDKQIGQARSKYGLQINKIEV
jgi:hypothetical protein